MQTISPTQLYIRWKCLTNPDSSNYNSISIGFAKKTFLNWESIFLIIYPSHNYKYYSFTNYTKIGINALGVASLSYFHYRLISHFFKNE